METDKPIELRCVRDFRGAALIVLTNREVHDDTIAAVLFLPHQGEVVGQGFVYAREDAELAGRRVRAWLHSRLQAVQPLCREPPELEPCEEADLEDLALHAPELLRAAMRCDPGLPNTARHRCKNALKKVEAGVVLDELHIPPP